MVLPSFHKSQPLCMCCTAEQMRSSSTGAPPKVVAETLGFLGCLNLVAIKVQTKGLLKARLIPSSHGEGGGDSCLLLTVLATLLVHGWVSVLSCSVTGMYCWSSHCSRRGCSPTTPTLGEWSWLVDADTSAYPLFFKYTLEKKKSSTQVGDFINISGTSAGTQLLIWCHTFLTSGLLTWGRPFLSLRGSVVSFHLVCSLVQWRGAGPAGGEQSCRSTLFQGMALELSRYSNSTENILLKPECCSKQTSLSAAKACGFLPCLAHAVFVCGGNSCLMYWQMY